MPKLYYTPTSCGGSNFIAAYVAGLNLECEQVVLATHTTASGVDFYSINPKGNVPCIVLDDGTILNENAATLQYIVDNATTTKVGAPYGTSDRYKLQNTLSYISSEFHGSIGHLFYVKADTMPEVNEYVRTKLATKLKYMENNLVNGGKKFLVGDSFTVADSYAHIVLSWVGYLNVDLTPYPNLKAYYDGICAIPAVAAAKARMDVSPATVL